MIRHIRKCTLKTSYMRWLLFSLWGSSLQCRLRLFARKPINRVLSANICVLLAWFLCNFDILCTEHTQNTTNKENKHRTNGENQCADDGHDIRQTMSIFKTFQSIYSHNGWSILGSNKKEKRIIGFHWNSSKRDYFNQIDFNANQFLPSVKWFMNHSTDVSLHHFPFTYTIFGCLYFEQRSLKDEWGSK